MATLNILDLPFDLLHLIHARSGNMNLCRVHKYFSAPSVDVVAECVVGRGLSTVDALHLFSRNGKLEHLTLAVRNHVDSSEYDDTMHAAAERKDAAVVRELLSQGATDRHGRTLALCSARGDTELVAALLDGATEEGTAAALVGASSEGRADVVRLLLSHCAATLGENGRTALKAAIKKGSAEVAKVLLASGVDPNYVDSNLESARFVEMAALEGRADVVRCLLAHDADANANGGMPLRLASAKGHAEVVSLLFEANARREVATAGTAEAIVISSEEGHLPVVRMLLDLNVDPNQLNGTALHQATSRGHEDVVRLLLERGARTDAMGGTPLVQAAAFGYVGIVRALLESGADPNAAATQALLQAYRRDHVEILALLLEHGADPSTLNESALIVKESAKGRERVVAALLDRSRVSDEHKGKALVEASSKGHSSVVQALLRSGAVADVYGGRSLFKAACKGNAEVVKVLLQHGAQPLSRVALSRVSAMGEERGEIVRLISAVRSNRGLSSFDL